MSKVDTSQPLEVLTLGHIRPRDGRTLKTGTGIEDLSVVYSVHFECFGSWGESQNIFSYLFGLLEISGHECTFGLSLITELWTTDGFIHLVVWILLRFQYVGERARIYGIFYKIAIKLYA